MNRRVESHSVATGFQNESFIYLFDGFPYNYAELSSRMINDQENVYRSVHTGSYKFEAASSGSTPYYGFGHAHWEVDHLPQTVEDPHEPLTTRSAPGIPEESIRTDGDSGGIQILLEDDIDPDNMTYEELLDLGEAVGTQSRGLSQELIASLPVSKYKSCCFFSRRKSQAELCVICQMKYKRGNRQLTLPCKHVYHAKCATKWLSISKACPICYTDVIDTNKNQT